MLANVAESIGKVTRESIEQVGSISFFFLRVLRATPFLVKKIHLLIEQLLRVGVNSLPLISLISIFIGLITVWQAKYFFQNIIPYTLLGTVVGKAVLIDLGPVLSALVITGRVGAMLAAELGTMRVTEQVDAMECLSLDPYLYLLSPRVLAGFIMMPILGIYSSFIALICAQVLATLALGVSPAIFYNGIRMLYSNKDLVISLTKAFVFGGVITLTGTYFGYYTYGGAVEVGRSTNRAVVAASVLILISNFVVVSFLL